MAKDVEPSCFMLFAIVFGREDEIERWDVSNYLRNIVLFYSSAPFQSHPHLSATPLELK